MSKQAPASTLKELFEGSLRKYADRPALHFDGETVTYRELDRRSNALANAFVADGVSVGEPLALMLSNSMSYVVLDLALFKAGAARFALNDMLSTSECAYMLSDANAETVVVDDGFADTFGSLRDDIDTIERVYGVGTDAVSDATAYETLLESGDSASSPDVDVGPEDTALHAYTGGTTGRPKGLVHTNQGMAANMYTTALELSVTGDDRQLLTTPLPHSAGGFLWAGFLTGAEAWLHEGFDADRVLRTIERERITWTFAVPTMIYRLLDNDGLDERVTESLETVVYGAAPMTKARLKEALAEFGPVFVQFYGQGECPNFITTLQKSEHELAVETGNEQRLGSAGQPCLMTEIRIVDPETGETLPQGESGEVAATAPYVMERYHRRPEATEETLVDGWVLTGDVGRIDDDGYLYLLDRKSDMIVSGGMNVYSVEVEDALSSHDAVKEVAVIGVPDDEWGEAVKAVVVPYDDATVSEAELVGYAGDQLAAYKKPKSVEFRGSLPRTPYDKIDKVSLREPYWADEERQVT